jgi:outer membrane lipoprotein carrier protein
MRNILLCLLFFSVLTTQAQIKMTDLEASNLKSQVKTLANSIKTISSDFVQYKHLDFLENDIETSGKLAFKSPDLLKWEYLKPYKYVALFKNETLYINDEEKNNSIDIGSNKMFKQLNNLIVSSVKGDMFDENKFNIQYFKTSKNSVVYFSPKDEKFAKYIKIFHITFNEKGDVIEVKIIEPSGDYTKIVFTNKVLNQPIDEAVFTN